MAICQASRVLQFFELMREWKEGLTRKRSFECSEKKLLEATVFLLGGTRKLGLEVANKEKPSFVNFLLCIQHIYTRHFICDICVKSDGCLATLGRLHQ